MHTVAEAQSIMRTVPRFPDEPKLVWVKRVGALFGLTFSQAKKINYGEVKDMRASRLDAMRAKLEELEQGAVRRRGALDDIQARLTDLRTAQGSREASGHSGGTISTGRGSLGAGEGGSGKG